MCEWMSWCALVHLLSVMATDQWREQSSERWKWRGWKTSTTSEKVVKKGDFGGLDSQVQRVQLTIDGRANLVPVSFTWVTNNSSSKNCRHRRRPSRKNGRFWKCVCCVSVWSCRRCGRLTRILLTSIGPRCRTDIYWAYWCVSGICHGARLTLGRWKVEEENASASAQWKCTYRIAIAVSLSIRRCSCWPTLWLMRQLETEKGETKNE